MTSVLPAVFRSTCGRRWLLVVGYLSVTYATLPYIPAWRDAFTDAVGLERVGQGVGVLLTVAGAGWLVSVIIRRRERRVSVYIGFVVIAGAYGYAFSQVSIIIEKIHFIQYGLLGGLIYWALRATTRDSALYAHGVLLVTLSGLLDELIQAAIPDRVGDLRDVYMNAVAGGLVLAFIAAVVRPPLTWRRPTVAGGRMLAVEVSALIILSAVFASRVSGFGYRITDPQIGTFYSTYTRSELLDRDRQYLAQPERAAFWVRFTETVSTAAPDDPYFDEGYVHRFRRDTYFFKRQNSFVAYKEHLVLTTFYRAYLQQAGGFTEWTDDATRRCLAEAGRRGREPYDSPVRAHLITRFSERTMWIVVVCIVGGVVFCGVRASRRRVRGQ
ncbi:MAG: VanZ family protein [Candidatus Latescibacteria bacterium]|nr:VanZ family protein [Candidatus Latescibacterota bacterium]